jgi:hypothetical protein
MKNTRMGKIINLVGVKEFIGQLGSSCQAFGKSDGKA